MLNNRALNMPSFMPLAGQSLDQFRLAAHRIVRALWAYGWIKASSLQEYFTANRQIWTKQIHCFSGTVSPSRISNCKSRTGRDQIHPGGRRNLPTGQYRSAKHRVRGIGVSRFPQTN